MIKFHAQVWYYFSRRLSGLDMMLTITPERVSDDKWKEMGAELEALIQGCDELTLGGHFKSGQLGSVQNRPTEVARNC